MIMGAQENGSVHPLYGYFNTLLGKVGASLGLPDGLLIFWIWFYKGKEHWDPKGVGSTLKILHQRINSRSRGPGTFHQLSCRAQLSCRGYGGTTRPVCRPINGFHNNNNSMDVSHQFAICHWVQAQRAHSLCLRVAGWCRWGLRAASCHRRSASRKGRRDTAHLTSLPQGHWWRNWNTGKKLEYQETCNYMNGVGAGWRESVQSLTGYPYQRPFKDIYLLLNVTVGYRDMLLLI